MASAQADSPTVRNFSQWAKTSLGPLPMDANNHFLAKLHPRFSSTGWQRSGVPGCEPQQTMPRELRLSNASDTAGAAPYLLIDPARDPQGSAFFTRANAGCQAETEDAILFSGFVFACAVPQTA